MGDITKIILTSSLTVIGGVIVFVTGQLLIKFIIEPIHDLKKTLGEIRYLLVFHAPAIETPVGNKEMEDRAQDALRKISCDLRSKIDAIPLYRLWALISCGFLPSKKNVLAAATHLIGLSNSVYKQDRSKNLDISNKISLLLNLDTE